MSGTANCIFRTQINGEFRNGPIDSLDNSTKWVLFTTSAIDLAIIGLRATIVVALACLLFVSLPLSGKAQLYVGIGLQAGFTNMPNANVPVDRYNARAFLYKRMNRFHFPFGEIYDVSYRSGRALLDLNLNTRRARATAKSTTSTGIQQRDVRFSLQSLSLGAGYAAVDQEKFVMYMGGSVDAGYMRMLTRTAITTQIRATDYYLWRRSPMLALSAFAKMVFRSSPDAMTVTSITLYFQFPLQKFDFLALEQLLNQGSLQPINVPLPARPWNVGVAFSIDLDLLGFLIK